jgi:putative ATP-dependent endonuclease of OLD family
MFVSTDNNDKEYFSYRTEFSYDPERKVFDRTRKAITDWDASPIAFGNGIGQKTMAAFDFILLDAHRDMADDIRNRNSRWNKELAQIELDDATRTGIESSLEKLGSEIVKKSNFLSKAQADVTAATNIVANETRISPISRTVNDLYKGLDIYIKQDHGSSLPLSNYGSGTRSRAVFAVLNTILQTRIKAAVNSPYYCLVVFEEPEAHVHPHAQKQLLLGFSGLPAQRLLTTHSPYLLATSGLDVLIGVTLQNAETETIDLSAVALDTEEKRKISRFVLNTRGEILFTPIVVLAEGETEEQSLPVFFKEYFGQEAFDRGVIFVGAGGQNYKPFLQILNALAIEWFIFSDGEDKAIKTIQNAIKDAGDLPKKPKLASYPNVVVLNDGANYEQYLIHAGYQSEIRDAINKIEGSGASGASTTVTQTFLEYFANARPNLASADEDTVLETCMMAKDHKAKYAPVIAAEICSMADTTRRIPPKHLELFKQIEKVLR